jgi:adenylate cyclase
MAELLVAGPEPMQRWRRPIPPGEVIRLGRAPRSGWAVPWDLLISREHADLELVEGKLRVRRLDASRNPISFRGADNADFLLNVGEQFRIGRTLFQLVSSDREEDLLLPAAELSFHPDEIRTVAFQDPDLRLEVLAKLPKAIAQTTSDEELASRVVGLVLEAIPTAAAAAVVFFEDLAADAQPRLMRWETRDASIERFSPSRRLMNKALQSGQGMLHIWSDTDEPNPAFTASGLLDWAFCMPYRGDASNAWCLYVSGLKDCIPAASIGEDHLKGNLRFAELLCEFIGSIRQVRLLSKQQASLSQFFSPTVLDTMRQADADRLLEPRESDITVLFCDVRGFSAKSEQHQQNLRELLDRVSAALGVMTCGIIKYDGVIADFQGDAALGFWGWPAAREDDRLSACRAALHIQREFQLALRDSLEGFQVGIGLAHGRAIAGKIGTAEQIKVGAFGPTVNLGARLEGLTKTLGASIVMDDATAEYVREVLVPSEGRLRRLGRFRPAGMSAELTLTQLLPSVEEDPTVTDEAIARYEAAWDLFASGSWREAVVRLNGAPVEDRAKDFLLEFIARHDGRTPSDWHGVIALQSK